MHCIGLHWYCIGTWNHPRSVFSSTLQVPFRSIWYDIFRSLHWSAFRSAFCSAFGALLHAACFVFHSSTALKWQIKWCSISLCICWVSMLQASYCIIDCNNLDLCSILHGNLPAWDKEKQICNLLSCIMTLVMRWIMGVIISRVPKNSANLRSLAQYAAPECSCC